MNGYNKIILVGRMTRDAEHRIFDSGNTLTEFCVAVGGRYKNDRTGQWDEKTEYLDCKVWGPRGNFIVEHCGKGDTMLVEGKLTIEKWEDQQGQKKQKAIINAFKFERLTDRRTLGASVQQPPMQRQASPTPFVEPPAIPISLSPLQQLMLT